MGRQKTTNNKKELIAYLAIIAASLLIAIWVHRLWLADLSIPFDYVGDAIFGQALVKGIIKNGWYMLNPHIGAPFTLLLYDYPGLDLGHYLLIKLISMPFPSFGLTLNLFYIATYPLIAISSFFALRQMKISYIVSVFGSLIIAFLPFHWMRGQGHLFLGSYYTAPLIVLVILWLNSDEPLLFFKTNNRIRLRLKGFKAFASIIIAVLIASTGLYYAFFAVIFMLLVGFAGFVYKKNISNLFSSLFLILVIVIVALTILSPSFIYKWRHGANKEVAVRSWVESEVYALKITQLVLPVVGHRIDFLARAKSLYNQKAPLINENDTATLGLIGSVGFVFLLAWVLFRKSLMPNLFSKEHIDYLNSLSIINISSVLIAVIGGFGTLFAGTISPQLRAYNRISVYIGIFSIFAIAILIDSLFKKYSRSIVSRSVFVVAIALLLVMGILDQTTNYMVPAYTAIKDKFNNDRKFIKKIEETLPEGSMVYQLPFVPFPEHPPVGKMVDYSHFRAYLHSDKLRWSYGAMKGRPGGLWHSKIASKPTAKIIETLSIAGFKGIYVDRFGYDKNGANIEKELSRILKVKPIVSNNNRLSFFSMARYKKTFRKRYSLNYRKKIRARVFANIKNETSINADK